MSTFSKHGRDRRRVMTGLSLIAGVVALAGPVAVAGTFYATPAEASASPSPARVIVLWGDGIAGLLGQGTLVGAHFGWTEPTAVRGLDSALGAPKTPSPVKESGHCDVDGVMEWPALTAYFDSGHFVGYSTLSPAGGPLSTAGVATLDGLRVGNTIAEARQIYGRDLHLSSAQGGSWSAKTANGTVDGYLTAEVGQKSASPRISSIEAGAVGCPAGTP